MRDFFRTLHWHRWSNVGVFDGDDIMRPCLIGDCASAYVKRPAGTITIRHNVFFLQADGQPLTFEDDERGGIAKIIAREIEQDYKLADIDFSPGDVVLDIGAHVGVVSIWLAKKYPFLRIFAFEPIPDNFKRLVKNIRSNDVYTVTPINRAVYDGGGIEIYDDLESNSGGGSAFYERSEGTVYQSLSLPGILAEYGIDKIKLLKIDCEGAEYKILTDDTFIKQHIGHIVGEFHNNSSLADAGYNGEALKARLEDLLPGRVVAHVCRMGE